MLAIPRFGLGDILYTCIALSVLRRGKNVGVPIVFCPPKATELVTLFGLSAIPLYPKALHLDRKLETSLGKEAAFWHALVNRPRSEYFSLINDMFDKVVFEGIGGHKPFVSNMGNYLQARPGGIRATVNRLIGYRWNIEPNPKHIAARALRAIRSLRDISLTEFFEHGRDVLSSAVSASVYGQEPQSRWEMVVLPDAASEKRCIDTNQLNGLLAKAKQPEKCLVVSQRLRPSHIHDGVVFSDYPSLGSLWTHLRCAETVVSADSFGAHFAATAFPERLLVIYPDELPIQRYWEYWGIPLENAVHVWKSRCFVLSANFDSQEIDKSETCFADIVSE